MTRELHAVVTVDHSNELRQIGDRSYNRARSIHIRFSRDGDGYVLQAWGNAFPQDGGGGYRGRLAVGAAALAAGIDLLRSTWQEHVVEHVERSGGVTRFPFIDGWDLSGLADRHRIDRVGLKLARAGHALFLLLFADGDAGLKEVGDHLTRALRDGEQVITMESDELFVPWGMLYIPPDDASTLWGPDATWSMRGFWGYRHLVEHTFSRVPGFDTRIVVTSGRVVVGLNIDEGVDDKYPPTPFIGPVVDFFEAKTDVAVRRCKDEFAVALQSPDFNDHITYFGCHGKVSGGGLGQSYMALGDGEKIYSSEVVAWLAGRPLPSKPVVFAGACQGGQLSSLFYQTFGHHLLHHGARCLIGPQIDLPRAFAREYTTRLFSAFLEPRTRLGDVVRELAREFADEHHNPLGLIFSLYRGLDIHLWPAEQR